MTKVKDIMSKKAKNFDKPATKSGGEKNDKSTPSIFQALRKKGRL